MKLRIAVLIMLGCCVGALRADEVIAEVQQALKDQGFYYGEINGEKNADTTAAIRRYQIRNALQVTGELDNDTLRALRSVPSTTSPPPPPVTTAPSTPPTPASSPAEPQREPPLTTPAPADEQEIPPGPRSAPGGPYSPGGPYPGGQDRQLPYPPAVPNASTQPGGLFADTPYAAAPLQVQRDVIVSAQRALSRRGYYRGTIDGAFNSTLEFSLRAYQSKVGLPVTGRLDLETLAALELLPGAKAPVYRPRRRVPPPFRGEWIRP
jgi:peptidoglycan hydrolase-like protein with peptidoglycan-binding domain